MEAKRFEATPREVLEIDGMRVIEDEQGSTVAYAPFDEDAEFIVRACNAHNDLVKALCDLLEDQRDASLPVLAAARAALAKASQ